MLPIPNWPWNKGMVKRTMGLDSLVGQTEERGQTVFLEGYQNQVKFYNLLVVYITWLAAFNYSSFDIIRYSYTSNQDYISPPTETAGCPVEWLPFSQWHGQLSPTSMIFREPEMSKHSLYSQAEGMMPHNKRHFICTSKNFNSSLLKQWKYWFPNFTLMVQYSLHQLHQLWNNTNLLILFKSLETIVNEQIKTFISPYK